MINIISVAVGVYLLVVGGMYVFQRNLLYLPSGSVPVPAQSGVPEMRPVSLATNDGLELRSWYRPAETGLPTLVFFCGNAGNIGDRGFKVRPFLDAGLGVLLVGYRGYGGNPGSPSEEGLYADGRAALAFLRTAGVPAAGTVLYGESLGSGVVVQLAAEAAGATPFAALVLEAPFTSIAAVAASHYPFVPARWLVKDRFDSAAKIAGVGSPVFVLQGGNDRVVPTRFGRMLFAAAVEPKEGRWIAGAGHNDLYDFGGAEAVLDFLRRRLGLAAPDGLPGG